jgi:hypothetical protein
VGEVEGVLLGGEKTNGIVHGRPVGPQRPSAKPYGFFVEDLFRHSVKGPSQEKWLWVLNGKLGARR